MTFDYISILLTVLTSTVITTIAFLLYNNLRRSRYDQEKSRAILEDIRFSLEKQMYSINDKMMQNEERWRDINHLFLRKEYKDDYFSFDFNNNRRVQLNDFLKSNGITEKDLIVERRTVFVLTPFHPEFEDDYFVIKRTCDEVGLTCIRGDESYFASDIFSQMLRLIVSSNLVIANLNGRNPNVLYELGIAQALDKPVILISRKPEELPIDIKSKRFLIYRDLDELRVALKNELIKALTK
jgi:hypothetical protein